MVEILIILTISATYSGIFTGTAMLEPLQDGIRRCCGKLGRFPVMVLLSIAMVVVFCNQTIATMMCCDLMKKPYLDDGGSREELAIDMENSVIVISGLVPWAIACSVSVSFIGVGSEAIPYSLYLYFVPLCYLFIKEPVVRSERKRKNYEQAVKAAFLKGGLPLHAKGKKNDEQRRTGVLYGKEISFYDKLTGKEKEEIEEYSSVVHFAKNTRYTARRISAWACFFW